METLRNLFDRFPHFGTRMLFIHRTEVRRRIYSYDAPGSADHGRVARPARCRPGGPRTALGAELTLVGVAFWGIAAHGGIAVPVDFPAGAERAAAIAELAGCRVVLQSRLKGEPLRGTTGCFLE